MELPKIKKRISNFLASEEGKISKQSLLTIGAFLGTASIGTAIMANNVFAQCPSGGESDCPGSPGDCQPIDKDALIGQNAYDANGNQIYFGTKKCSDDAEIFHFNGTEFSYAGTKLAAEHNHHGSHNSY